MTMKYIFGVLSLLAALLQYGPYIYDVLRHKTKPHMFSWFVWTLPCGVVFVAQTLKGAAAGSWATGITGILCGVIFVLSLRYGEKHITRVDWVALILGLLAIALWTITSDPLLAVIFSAASDVIGCVPTGRKSYHKPFEETLITYVLGNVKWLLSLFAVEAYTATTVIYPLAMFISNLSLLALLVWRRRCVTMADVQP